MLAKLKALLGKGSGAEVTRFFMGAKTEREALMLIKQARERDEKKRAQAQSVVTEMVNEEAKLMEEGRREGATELQKMNLVRRIKSLRSEAKTHQDLIDKVYAPRIRTYGEHMVSLQTILEMKEEPMPTLDQVEQMAVRAKTLLGDLDDTKEVADAIGVLHPAMQEAADPEDEKILAEMAELRRKDEEKKKEIAKAAAKAREDLKEIQKKIADKKSVRVFDSYETG